MRKGGVAESGMGTGRPAGRQPDSAAEVVCEPATSRREGGSLEERQGSVGGGERPKPCSCPMRLSLEPAFTPGQLAAVRSSVFSEYIM